MLIFWNLVNLILPEPHSISILALLISIILKNGGRELNALVLPPLFPYLLVPTYLKLAPLLIFRETTMVYTSTCGVKPAHHNQIWYFPSSSKFPSTSESSLC